MVFKKVVKFLYCFIVRIRDFIKKLRYSKSKILTKLYCLLFLFYFFSIFGIFFLYFTYPNLSKNYGIFLSCFIGMVGDFINDFWKILKVILKNILICEIFFSKFCDLLFVVFILLLFLKFYFQFRLCVLGKKF